jgi:hypothetical protein
MSAPKRDHSKNFLVTIQYEGQPPNRTAYESPDTARGRARQAWLYEPSVCQVVRRSDSVVIFDPHALIDVHHGDVYGPVEQMRNTFDPSDYERE